MEPLSREAIERLRRSAADDTTTSVHERDFSFEKHGSTSVSGEERRAARKSSVAVPILHPS